jgi:anti-sigma-K factor RskA
MTPPEHMAERRDCGKHAAAYALGALDREELEAFRAHLAQCAICRGEVNAFQEVVDTLPLLAPPQPVPRSLKRRVMAEVRAEPRPAAQAERKRLRLGMPTLFTAVPRPALVAATVLIAIVVAVGAVALSSGGGGTHVYSASVVGPGAAKLRVSDGRGELVVRAMPAPPRNDVYQVWLKRGQHPPTPTKALFDVTSNGAATVDVPGNLRGVDEVLVTPEPSGGSATPTHSPVIVARLG